MPNIKSAKKKMRQDVKREKHNATIDKKVTKLMKIMGKAKTVTAKKVSEAYSSIDKAVKHKVIHKNKAARLKSKVSGFISKK